MRLLKSTAIIGSLTMLSRILGLIRDIMLAKYLGAGVVNDALVTAIKLPNLFRRMFAEGAFNAAFVPLYARRIEGAEIRTPLILQAKRLRPYSCLSR
ncbi:lipid II flippase MurJ [Litorimonas sp. RW-G-Af-16]|uniref:lipid II flippase MurJ n=1 Tax=Litorimonas sp. RW-G-Af-16 TaxID=3241168 RepID=UPI003AAF89A4